MKLGIVGSGVVGKAVGMGLAFLGNSVIFHDVQESKLSALKAEGYDATCDVRKVVCGSEVVFVCVPTPTIDGQIDLGYVRSCAKAVGEALKQAENYVVVAFKSTVLPQTTRTKLLPVLERHSGLKADGDFGVCINPEFLRQHNALVDFLTPDRIVIGEFDRKSGDVLEKLYSPFSCPIIRTDLDTAEMIKYASNLFLASKISFFNEIYMVCSKLGLNADTVSKATSLDQRIGKYGVYGGKPFDGKCFPKDLDAFITFAKEKEISPKLLRAVREINQTMDGDENAALNIVGRGIQFMPDGFAEERILSLRETVFTKSRKYSIASGDASKKTLGIDIKMPEA